MARSKHPGVNQRPKKRAPAKKRARLKATTKRPVYIQHTTKADRDAMAEAKLAWERMLERDRENQKGGRPKKSAVVRDELDIEEVA